MSKITPVTKLLVGRLIDIGRQRTEQQDNLRVANMFDHEETLPLAKRKGNLYVLADGVGGEAGGAIASQVAVETVVAEYYADSSHDIEASLVAAIREANKRIVEEGRKRQLPRMRTTIVCAVLRGNELVVAHLGDSRCYLIKGGEVTRLTQDHTMARYWRESGELSEEQISKRGDRKNLSRSLGSPDGVEPEVGHQEIETNDTFMLCSDGLYGVVKEAQLGTMVISHPTPQSACETLVRLANEAGGPDNISVIIGSIREVVEEVAHKPLPNDLDVPKLITTYVDASPPLSESEVAMQTINRLRKWLTWSCGLLGIVVLLALLINFNLLTELNDTRDRLETVINRIDRLSSDYQTRQYGTVDEAFLQELRAIEEVVKDNVTPTIPQSPIIISRPTNQPTLSPTITPTHTVQPPKEGGS